MAHTARQRPNADERFRKLIDDFNFYDLLYKEVDRERTRIIKKLRNIIRRRGRGTHNGNESSIYAHDVVRLVLSNDKVREALSEKEFNRCFKKSKYIQIDGGPHVPSSKEVPDLGPAEVQEVQPE